MDELFFLDFISHLFFGYADIIEELLVGGDGVLRDARLVVVVVATGIGGLGQTMTVRRVRCTITVSTTTTAPQWFQLLSIRASF